MDASLRAARSAVMLYLNGLLDERVDAVAFVRLYANASETCAQAGLTLGQLRLQMLKGGAN
jgi:hypothetical protein